MYVCMYVCLCACTYACIIKHACMLVMGVLINTLFIWILLGVISNVMKLKVVESIKEECQVGID